ncbi:hypothetical protein [Mesorhizobium sp. M0847]|uniref:hypothetical protein n=1 Tax=unclassified Mesorhizobium TaxID=325217 RepID=UPI00333B18DD
MGLQTTTIDLVDVTSECHRVYTRKIFRAQRRGSKDLPVCKCCAVRLDMVDTAHDCGDSDTAIPQSAFGDCDSDVDQRNQESCSIRSQICRPSDESTHEKDDVGPRGRKNGIPRENLILLESG